jgi:hypothetical protein
VFPKNFSELIVIKGYLGDMRIELKPESRLVKHRTYQINPQVKEKVKKEIYRMLIVLLIFPVDKAEWINPIMIQTNKGTYHIRVCVDYRSLNITCVHDPFPIAFSDEVLDKVTGTEAHSSRDGFSRYHQVQIVEEDKKNTIFTTEWGSFSYNFMPFKLNNPPMVFSQIMIKAFHDFIHNFLEVYLDNWTIYILLKENIELSRLMLDRLESYRFPLIYENAFFVYHLEII